MNATQAPLWNLDGKPGNMAALIALSRSRIRWCVAVACAFVWLGSSELLAQAPSNPPGGSGATTIIVQGRSLAFEWIITIAMCGVALFVVCRSSRRN